MNHECKKCGRIYTEVPAGAKSQLDWEGKETQALQWLCDGPDCGSTMTKLIKPLIKPSAKILKVG